MTTETTTTTAKATRNRKPSPFTPAVKVTISVHNDATGVDVTSTALETMLNETYGEGHVTRTVSGRTRTVKAKPGKVVKTKPAGPVSVMYYIAPEGYKFAAATERGVRLDSDTAKLLRAVAEKMGLDPNDPASIGAVAKALAQKATA